MPDSISDGVIQTFFSTMIANPQGAQWIGERIDVPGANGIAIRKREKKPEPFSGYSRAHVPTTSFSASNAASLRAAYDIFVSKMVTLDLQSVSYPDIYVNSVVIRPHTPLVAGYFVTKPDGTEMTEDCYLVEADWSFIYGGVVTP